MKRPTDVTVIVPTFRRPLQAIAAIESALVQEGVAVEVRVVDDSPEGSAREAVEGAFGSMVTYSLHSPPSGGHPGPVRNVAWPAATGRYVHFLDDDDVVPPGAYRAHVATLDANPGAGMSFGRIEPFGLEGEALQRECAVWKCAGDRGHRAAQRGPRLSLASLCAELLFRPALFANSACMVRQRCLTQLGGFDPGMPINEETELHLRVIRTYGFAFVDRVVARYSVSPQSLMRRTEAQARLNYAYRRLQQRYRAEYGIGELLALRALALALP